MKISDLMKFLNDKLSKHGDMRVCVSVEGEFSLIKKEPQIEFEIRDIFRNSEWREEESSCNGLYPEFSETVDNIGENKIFEANALIIVI